MSSFRSDVPLVPLFSPSIQGGQSLPFLAAPLFKSQPEFGKFCNKSLQYLQRFLAASLHFTLPANLHIVYVKFVNFGH